MSTDDEIEERASRYAKLYDVTDIDLRGELERTALGWTIDEAMFDKFVDEVIELVRIAIYHAHESGATEERTTIVRQLRHKLMLTSFGKGEHYLLAKIEHYIDEIEPPKEKGD